MNLEKTTLLIETIREVFVLHHPVGYKKPDEYDWLAGEGQRSTDWLTSKPQRYATTENHTSATSIPLLIVNTIRKHPHVVLQRFFMEICRKRDEGYSVLFRLVR